MSELTWMLGCLIAAAALTGWVCSLGFATLLADLHRRWVRRVVR